MTDPGGDDPIDFEKAKEEIKKARKRRKAMGDDADKAKPKMNGHAHVDGELHFKRNGTLETNVHNAIVILKRDHKGKFRYNQCVLGIEYTGGERPHLLTDRDITEIQDTLQCSGLQTIGRETVRDAIADVAEDDDNAHHPIRDWLEFLEWDGVARVDWLFSAYFGAEPDATLVPGDYCAKISAMFLIGMVARVYEPGCQQDHMPVIEGPQGQRKSTACRILAGDKFFGDSLPDISNKDSSQYLRGKWLVEVAEMHVHSRAETSAMKSFVSRRTERYFARYGRAESNEPRQCCFIGTTNEDEYLKDSTGGRRFWPIMAGVIDCEALERDRDQLFAEAVHRYKAREPWWPDGAFERIHIKPQQDARLESDLWDEAIFNYLKDKERVTAKQVVDWLVALELVDRKRAGKVEKGRIRDIFRKFGWVPNRSAELRWWEKPRYVQR